MEKMESKIFFGVSDTRGNRQLNVSISKIVDGRLMEMETFDLPLSDDNRQSLIDMLENSKRYGHEQDFGRNEYISTQQQVS